MAAIDAPSREWFRQLVAGANIPKLNYPGITDAQREAALKDLKQKRLDREGSA